MDEQEPRWAIRFESRLESIEGRVIRIESDGLESRVSTLEQSMSDIATKINGVHFGLKFFGGTLAFLWTTMQILSLAHAYGVL